MLFDSARHAACSTLHAVCCTLHAVAPCCSIYAVYLRIVQVVFNTLISIVTHPQPALISCCFIIRPSFCLHLCEKVQKNDREREEREKESKETVSRFFSLFPARTSRQTPADSFVPFAFVLYLLVYFSWRFLWLFICFQFSNCARYSNKCMHVNTYVYVYNFYFPCLLPLFEVFLIPFNHWKWLKRLNWPCAKDIKRCDIYNKVFSTYVHTYS